MTTTFRKTFRVLVLALTLAASVIVGTQTAAPADAYRYNWGAIAFNTRGATAGVADMPSSAAAQRHVLRRCGPGCGSFTFYNSCGAIAYAGNYSKWAWARGYRSPGAVRSAALRKLGRPGFVRNWVCTTR